MTILKQAMVADIPVLWAEPATQAPRKLVIWLPGFSGSKESVQNNLLDLAAAGFVGLSFDPCQHGERRRVVRPANIRGRRLGLCLLARHWRNRLIRSQSWRGDLPICWLRAPRPQGDPCQRAAGDRADLVR